MARSKGEETDVAKIPPIYLRAWHNSRTCKCMTTALLPRHIENTRGIWNVKGLSEHTRPPAWRASGKLGRVYFENCPLSLSRRVTTNSFFPMNFNRVNRVASTPIDAIVRTYLCRRGVDFKFSRDDRPRDSAAPLWRGPARKWETSRRTGTVRALFF